MNRLEKQVLQLLAAHPRNFWELVSRQDFTTKQVVETLNKMHDQGKIKTENGTITLTHKTSIKPKQKVRCEECDARGFVPSAKIKLAMNKWKQITEDKLTEKGAYYQEAITPESVAAKLAFMHDRADIENNKIFVVGDDDFFGIALALTNLPEKVQVIDIDKRIVEKTNALAKEHDLNLKANVYNAAEPLQEKWVGAFDSFVMEPPEALNGQLAFVSRGAQALKLGGVGYTTLTNVDSSLEKWYKYEGALHGMGFVITDIVRKFIHYPDLEQHEKEYATYPTAKVPKFDVGLPPRGGHWYEAHMVRLELAKPAKPLYPERIDFDDSFFMDPDTWCISKELLEGKV